MTQPLNEAYHQEVLEAYQEISDTFEEYTKMVRKRVPYEEWTERLKIVGVSEELKKEYETPENADNTSDLRLQKVYCANEMIHSLLDEEIFSKLSSSNPYWTAETAEELLKLNEIRCTLKCLYDNLWQISNMIEEVVKLSI